MLSGSRHLCRCMPLTEKYMKHIHIYMYHLRDLGPGFIPPNHSFHPFLSPLLSKDCTKYAYTSCSTCKICRRGLKSRNQS